MKAKIYFRASHGLIGATCLYALPPAACACPPNCKYVPSPLILDDSCHPLLDDLFDIILCRFVVPPVPAVIIYDNRCKLHQYALNREPRHFRDMKFLVDRFHWRGHIGCSSGYSLDRYTSLDIVTINSQVHEQANAGLQKIKGQIAYMKPENFMFHVKLFLAMHNRDKQHKLDVSAIEL